MNNSEKLATYSTQDTTQKNSGHRVQKTKTNKTQQRKTGDIGYKKLRQTKHNTEKLATQGTKD